MNCWFDSNIKCEYANECKCYPWSKECKRIYFEITKNG